MSHYEILGVPRSATQAQIEAAFEEWRRTHNSRLLSFDRARATIFAKHVAEAYRVLHDLRRRKEYDEILERQESPVEDGAIPEEEFRLWLKAGSVSDGLNAKIKKHLDENEKAWLAAYQREMEKPDYWYIVWRTFQLLLIIGLGIGVIWILITAIRYFWTHPLF